MSDLFSRIKQEKERYADRIILNTGNTFSLNETLRKIEMYYDSRFLSGDKDSDGFKKRFFNICKFPTNAAAKAIDIDVSNIRVVAKKGKSIVRAYLFEVELGKYMRENNFTDLFNTFAMKFPRYGEIVAKDVAGEVYDTPIRNLRWDPSVPIDVSPWTHELHLLTFDELREMAQKNNWDDEKVDKIVAMYNADQNYIIDIVERYGYNTDGNLTRSFVAGYDFFENDQKDVSVSPMVIAEDEVKKRPYRSRSWDTRDGRGLGVGVVEDLFQNQETANEVTNMERKSLYWSGKKIFQTRDPNAPKNLFNRVKNGEVLTGMNQEITQLSMEDRGLASYNLIQQRLGENTNQLSFSFEVNTGQALPSGTPFRLAGILQNAVNSYYDMKREIFASFIKEIIVDFVIPKLKKEKRKAHVVTYNSDTSVLKNIDEMIIDATIAKAIKTYEKKTGKLPTAEEYEQERARITERLQRTNNRFMEVPDNFYDDILDDVDIIITGEERNIESETTTLTTLLQVIGQNPAILQDENTRRIVEQIASLTGRATEGMIRAPQQAPQLPISPDGQPVDINQVVQPQ